MIFVSDNCSPYIALHLTLNMLLFSIFALSNFWQCEVKAVKVWLSINTIRVVIRYVFFFLTILIFVLMYVKILHFSRIPHIFVSSNSKLQGPVNWGQYFVSLTLEKQSPHIFLKDSYYRNEYILQLSTNIDYFKYSIFHLFFFSLGLMYRADFVIKSFAFFLVRKN